MKSEARPPLTVYYDAACPMCATEMRTLQAAAGEQRLCLVDCSAPDFDPASRGAEGVTRDDMMSRLHARDAAGRWLRALDAYEAVYRAAGYPRAARLWGSRLLRPLLDRGYLWVARNRMAISRVGLHRVLAWVMRR